jgi:glycosyltransferase involved in cell wall biosynthesis
VDELVAADESVQYLGLLSHEGVDRELRSAAVSVVASLFPETMGLSAVESLIAGTPLISSGRGALADLSGPGVWTLSQADVPSIRAALIRLLIEGEARKYRRDLAARDMSAYRFDRMVDAIEAEYRRTSAEYRGAPKTG